MSHDPRRPGAPKDGDVVQAMGHARNRLLHACEAISLIAGLALLWRKSYTPVFTVKGAKLQDSTAPDGQQAAHLLPGQILIDGQTPWDLASGDTKVAAWQARFMVTSAVPASFNKADSAAEANGLKEAFRAACERAWSYAIGGGRDLTAIYETFLADADRAFQDAENAKHARQTSTAALGATSTSEDRLVERVILKIYRLHGVTAKEANRLFPLANVAP
jgi:hypothetical protein